MSPDVFLSLKRIDLSGSDFREEPVPLSAAGTVTALGNFDGVHTGHRALLYAAVETAKALSDENRTVFPAAFLFRRPPADFLKNPPPPHLSPLPEKLRLLAGCGIRYAFIGEFPHLASLSPEDFVRDLLVGVCHTRHAVCGFNFTFGKGGSGTPERLHALLPGAVTVIPPVLSGGQPVSSSRIRALLCQGDAEEATRLLGHPYALTSEVLHGKALGRTISFPTLNQDFPQNVVVPLSGIYATRVLIPGLSAPLYGVSNVGCRPTVDDDHHVNCETYLIDFSGDLYGQTVRVEFLKRLREERKMSGIDELKETIRNDEINARKYFGLP